MRFEDVETIKRETSDGQAIRLSDGIEGDSFSVVSHGQHGSGRFLDFARNDGRRLETIRRETSDGKHADQAAPVGNAPLSPLRGTSTRRGKFALHSVFALISNARHSAGKSAPSGGKVVR